MGAWLSSALMKAHELATKRGQTASTAHLLAALYRGEPSVRMICGLHGLREVTLMAELVFVEERVRAIDEILERAHKLAAATGTRRVLPMHVLHFLAHEPWTASQRVLRRLGVSPERLSQAALDELEEPGRHRRPFAGAQHGSTLPPTAARPLPLGMQPSVNDGAPAPAHAQRCLGAQRDHRRLDGLWLGDEVEARLRRRGGGASQCLPVTFSDLVEARLRRPR